MLLGVYGTAAGWGRNGKKWKRWDGRRGQLGTAGVN
jgi:hypothetical protein